MRKLLLSLGSLTLGITATSSAIVSINNSSRFDPIDKFETPYEMIETSKILDKVISNPQSYQDIVFIENLLLQSTIMLDEIYSSTFFYNTSTKITQVLNIYKEQLERVETPNQSNFYLDLMNKSQEISINFIAKTEDPEIKNLFIEYEQLKREEAIKFFDIYDRKITTLNYELQSSQKSINDINVENAEIDEKLKGLAKENEIINSIFKLLDYTLQLAGNVKEIYSNGRTNIDVYYNSAEWHAKNWGLAFIPFYGTAFSINFKNNMDYAARGIQTYVDVFLTEGSDEYEQFQEMKENMENLRKQMLDVDPLSNDWITKLLEDAGLGEKESEILTMGIQLLVDEGVSKIPYVGKALEAIFVFIGVGFQAKKLADTFDEKLSFQYEEIKPLLELNDKTIAESYIQLLNTQKELTKKFKINNDKQEKLRKKMEQNLIKVNEENKKLDELKFDINSLNQKFIDTMNLGIFSDNYYYWQMNIISDIKPINSKMLISRSIEDINKQKNLKFNQLVKKINENGKNNSILKNLEIKNNLSNNNYSMIIKI
ncbi:hypothetical protein [Spiroplasma monobiae]|uniref:Uncharacterized protein n=1 Tax=Spiroplasma monobiae MQ-1 TaxID=1336748 RepID=A0A2K9LUV1_SPISQ|nr:hypothetical protein [Spiroplasma monobiae]AUM62826.1 hypothetical protein SMONO_v1c05770 [Spiroplasma monobiae MQ-1]